MLKTEPTGVVANSVLVNDKNSLARVLYPLLEPCALDNKEGYKDLK